MKMYQFRIVITLFVLAIYCPLGSYGFFWPLTALFGSKSSSSSSPVNNGELPEIILRPYVASDSNDLSQLSSPLSSPSSSNFFGSDVSSSSSLQTQQFPQQQQQQQTQSNYGYFNMDGSTSVYSGSNSHPQQQQLEQTYQSQQQIEQIPLEQSPVHSIISNEQQQQQPQQQQQQQSQEPAAISSYFFNPANLFDSKRFSYINRFKHQRQQQQQQPMSTSSTTKYVSSPNIDQNQYLIIPKPSASSNVEQQMPSQDNSQPQPLSTNNVQQQQQSQQTVPQQKHSANNWVYVSPVNKLNSQQQPILLEAYFQDPSIQQQFQQNYQVGSIKGLIGKTGKQRTSATNGNSVKMPLLSWLSIPSPNQIHLPLQWFKAKSTQQQNVDNQMNIDEQQQSQLQHYYSSTIQHQKPLHGYSSPSSSNYFTQSVINNGNSVGSKQPSPQQVQVQNSNQQQSMANGGSVWSSPAEASSSNRLLTGTLHSPQQSSALQFWVETDRQPGRVIFPKPTITTTQYSPQQQPYQTIQDYQPIRTGSPQTAVSQVEPNQDLGGWDSIQMADIVKPGQHQQHQSLLQQQQENGETMDSNIIETMMPSASSDQSVVMNETVPANQQQQQQQQARETITGQQQQSHRVVYQQQNSSQSINSTTPLPTTPTSNSRALYNHHPQFQSIYQMIQQSQQQQQQQQQQENSASQT